jgi:hypothetical protein
MFSYVCKEVNMLLYFWNNLVLKTKVHIKVLEMCFLWFKLDQGSCVHLPTLSLSCGGIWCLVDVGTYSSSSVPGNGARKTA